MPKSYAERITQTKVLIDGLKELKDSLPPGITEETITKLENLRSNVEKLNSEQESLKAELKKKTEQTVNELKEMDKLYSDTRKRIKLDVEQALWRKFGIEDKK